MPRLSGSNRRQCLASVCFRFYISGASRPRYPAALPASSRPATLINIGTMRTTVARVPVVELLVRDFLCPQIPTQNPGTRELMEDCSAMLELNSHHLSLKQIHTQQVQETKLIYSKFHVERAATFLYQ